MLDSRHAIASSVAFVVAASIAGCSDSGDTIGTTSEAIAGGDTRLTNTSEELPEVAVGRVNGPNSGVCTGSLIARDKVLTAAHGRRRALPRPFNLFP